MFRATCDCLMTNPPFRNVALRAWKLHDSATERVCERRPQQRPIRAACMPGYHSLPPSTSQVPPQPETGTFLVSSWPRGASRRGTKMRNVPFLFYEQQYWGLPETGSFSWSACQEMADAGPAYRPGSRWRLEGSVISCSASVVHRASARGSLAQASTRCLSRRGRQLLFDRVSARVEASVRAAR